MDEIKTILVTGNQGYIGSSMVPKLVDQGYHVIGLDLGVFQFASFLSPRIPPAEQRYQDIRDVSLSDLQHIDAVIHLAGISNDPLGEMDPSLTLEVNHLATRRLASLAKQAGVKRFVFSSSCSIYGASGGEIVDELAPISPITAYAKSKALVETDLTEMATASFAPIIMRNATVFGVSPRLRLDLVVQNLAASGYLTNNIQVLSDGSPWRPLLHLWDISQAFSLVLSLPASAVNNQIFNVAPPANTVQIKKLAALISAHLPDTTVSINQNASPDERTYRVSSQKILNFGWQPSVSLDDGIAEIINAFRATSFSSADNENPIFHTLRQYQNSLDQGVLDSRFRLRQAITI